MYYFVGNAHIIILSYALVFNVCMCSKYSKQANSKYQDEDVIDTDLDFQNQENPFRMQKVNLLWAKGKRVLSDAKLADLYAELTIHDKHEAHLKKLNAEDIDKDGKMEAKVLTNYRRIVNDYGLDYYSPNHGYMTNEIPLDDDEKANKNIQFQDSKLQMMWKKAEQAGFSDKDLNMLREEFWHQQMKINEHDFVHREMDKIADPDDNTIDPEDKKQSLSQNDKKEKKAALKKNKKVIKDGYIKLEHLVSSIPASEPTFKDSRVHKLWAVAKKTNWTEEELNEFKEELLHFEHRLNKQKYYQQQLELSSEILEDLKEGDEIPESHKTLEEKNRDLGHKIKKLHLHFKDRLDKALRHSEL